jgi:hypothetical protein
MQLRQGEPVLMAALFQQPVFRQPGEGQVGKR